MKNNKYKNTLIILMFFLIVISSIILVNIYGKKSSYNIELLINEKIDKVLYQFFNELVTNDIINKENVDDILIITKNSRGDILTVNYDLEKTYKILTDVTKTLSSSISDLEHGNIDIKLYDKYLDNGKNGLILYVPLFINSKNVFINNIGPRFPVLINFNENILSNIKTKVTNYGFNNALLEVYITVEMQKLIITPVKKEDSIFKYDILVSALVVNGSVPNFYGNTYESSSSIISDNFGYSN